MLPAEFPVPLAESPGLVLELLAESLVLELPAVSLGPLAESLELALELPLCLCASWLCLWCCRLGCLSRCRVAILQGWS